MVAGNQADKAVVFNGLVPGQILIKETADTAAAFFFKVAVIRNDAAFVVCLIIPHQALVAAAPVIQQEIHVETRLERLRWAAPLADHCRFGKFTVQHLPDIPPDCAGRAFVFIIKFYK